MIKGKKSNRKNISEPKFGKIFWIRFIIMLAVFSLVAVYAWNKLDAYVEEMVMSELYSTEEDIVQALDRMYLAGPDSDDYQKGLYAVKTWMAVLPNLNHTYAEVTVGDLKLTTEDTSFFQLTRQTDYKTYTSDTYFIEDMSYYEPLISYMDGKFDPRVEREMYSSWRRDPLFRELGLKHVGGYDYFCFHELITAYGELR